jgi:CRISPR-associated protein Cmr3
MSVWTIEPRDPLVARDGRPVGTGGALRTLGFPFPSTLAGAVRTRLAGGGGSFALNPAEIATLLAIEVAGPLLAELPEDTPETAEEGAATWLAPAPRDAILAQAAEEAYALRRLAPRELAPGETVEGLGALLPLQLDGAPVEGKPPIDPPAFWRWDAFESWLTAPGDRNGTQKSLGLSALLQEQRSHVAIRPGERVGIDGMLFTTVGLRFLAGDEKGPERLAPRRLALGLRCGGGEVGGRRLGLRAELAPLGGERRLARWRPAGTGWPTLPPKVRESVARTGCARLILLTPACFAPGALPGWTRAPGSPEIPVEVLVRAAAIGRPDIVSGWDLAADNGPGKPKGRPKPTRRLAPAGSVYFVELSGTPEDRARWCDAVWFQSISDGLQNRRDGFGLAAVGSWE